MQNVIFRKKVLCGRQTINTSQNKRFSEAATRQSKNKLKIIQLGKLNKIYS